MVLECMILHEHSLTSNLVSSSFLPQQVLFFSMADEANSAFQHTVLVELNNTLVYNDNHVLTQICEGHSACEVLEMACKQNLTTI